MTSSPSYVVRRSKIAGRGVFATRALPKDARIIEYTGERITHEEADLRYDDASMAQHHTLLFSIDDTYCIDAAKKGNSARFINHSCAPNCEAIQEHGRVFIFSLRPLSAGEELTYDYRYTYDRSIGVREARRRYPCHCGAETCRGTIVDLPARKKSKKTKRSSQATRSKRKPS